MKNLLIVLSFVSLNGLHSALATELKLPNQLIGLCKENNGLGETQIYDSGRGDRFIFNCTVAVYDLESFNNDPSKKLSDNFYNTHITTDKHRINSGIYKAFVRQALANDINSKSTLSLILHAECVPAKSDQVCDAEIFNTLKLKIGNFSQTTVKVEFNPAPATYDRCGGYYNESCDDGRGYIGG